MVFDGIRSWNVDIISVLVLDDDDDDDDEEFVID
jgi:hypothetical protein